jgi:hypothetical protein
MKWHQMAEDVVVMSFPLRTFGIDFRRNVTLLRLADRRVVIHSAAPFTEQNIADIRRFGDPAWLIDATLMHDTFAQEGHAALPDLPYFAPEGFAKPSGVSTQSLSSPPPDWSGEIEVLRIDGTRKREHALFHRRSRTLVVADLFFSLPAGTKGWPRFFARHIMRLPQAPRLFGVISFFRFMICDKRAFQSSMHALLQWDFEKVIVAHWEPVEIEAKQIVQQALGTCGFSASK